LLVCLLNMKMKKDSIEEVKIRLDKWSWAARFFKTRELAIKAIKQGKVLYDGQKANPSREVRIGVKLTITRADEEMTIKVCGLENKRQSAPIARSLFEETAESMAEREKVGKLRQERKWLHVTAPIPVKRPEKQARRKMRALRRQDEDT